MFPCPGIKIFSEKDSVDQSIHFISVSVAHVYWIGSFLVEYLCSAGQHLKVTHRLLGPGVGDLLGDGVGWEG